jgi:hypothetical protein
MRTHLEWMYVFMTAALVGAERSASLSGHFTLVKKAPGAQWIGGWAGSRAGLDDMVK